jgi:hypothetical protein
VSTKRKPASVFGPRVDDASEGRRPAGDLDRARGIAARVNAVRTRRGLTWPAFDRRVKWSKKTRLSRIRRTNPTPFTAEEIENISRAFDVSAD